MNAKVTKEQALRYAAQGLTILLVLAVAIAANFYFKIDELEATLSRARADADKAGQTAAAARKKLQDELDAAKAKSAALEEQQRAADTMKILVGKLEPQLALVLEAVAGAKTSKPDARVAALTGLGLIGQIARGTNNEAALAALDRALAIDNANCVAGLAVNLGGAKKIDVTPDCQALLPSPPAPAKSAAAEAKPAATEAKPAATEAKPAATEAKPAASAKPDAAPAAKAAPPAAKG